MSAPSSPSSSLQPSTLLSVVALVRARAAAGEHPVVVFDLDGTLFDNGPRTWQILVDLAESAESGAVGPTLRKALDAMPRTNLPYLLKETFARLGHDDITLIEKAEAFWAARFFTDEFQRYDEPVAGAVRYVDALYRAGATVVYLSGRDAPNMLVGCAAALRAHAFPVGIPRTALVLKHAFTDADLDFKSDAVAFMNQLGVVVGTFDNEPANCNLFAKTWPSAAHFFVATSHAPDPPPLLPAVVTLPDLVVADLHDQGPARPGAR